MEPQHSNIEWERLKAIIERIGFGEVRVIIQKGKPTRVENAIQSIRLDSPDDFTQALETFRL